MKHQYTEQSYGMKDLVEATGIHRQTVHSYLREGLLPAPTEGAGTRNARYGDAHVELLRLIRELRDVRGLSLDAIRRTFMAVDFDPTRVRQAIAEPPRDSALILGTSPETHLPAQLTRETGLEPAMLHALVEVGAIVASSAVEGALDDGAMEVALAAKALVEHALASDAVSQIAALAARLAGLEAKALVAEATGASLQQGPLFARAEERHRRIGALVNAVRLSALRRLARRLAEVTPRTQSFAHDAIYVPSALFVRRHGIERALAAVEAAAEAAAEREQGSALAFQRVGRVYLGLGRYAEANLWLERAAQRDPDLSDIWSYLGLAQALSGQVAQGLKSCRRGWDEAPDSPRAAAFLGAALALHAATTTGLGEATEALRQALAAARSSRGKVARDPFEHMEVLLARGRLFTVLPAVLKDHEEGESDLLEVLERTENQACGETGFDFPATGEVYRMHALFYLGMAAKEAGRVADAARWLRECITIDPASRFAERAYELLAGL